LYVTASAGVTMCYCVWVVTLCVSVCVTLTICLWIQLRWNVVV
jgi:hypothetical protein